MPVIINYTKQTVHYCGQVFHPGRNELYQAAYDLTLKKSGGLDKLMEKLNPTGIDEALEAAIPDLDDTQTLYVPAEPEPEPERWTLEELEDCSFAQLKTIANLYGIRGRSKADLIASIDGNLKQV